MAAPSPRPRGALQANPRVVRAPAPCSDGGRCLVLLLGTRSRDKPRAGTASSPAQGCIAPCSAFPPPVLPQPSRESGWVGVRLAHGLARDGAKGPHGEKRGGGQAQLRAGMRAPLPTPRKLSPAPRGGPQTFPQHGSTPLVITAISATPSTLTALRMHGQSRRSECGQQKQTEDKRQL